jgi:uncharacterized protein (TIGR02145 family)
MKIIILSLAFFSVLNWAYAQPGSITNIWVNQGTGVNKRVLDIQFDLTGSDATYDISLEVSFDNGGSYAPVDPAEVTGAQTVSPGVGIQLVWDGRTSYSGYFTEMARIKIIANSDWQCGDPITDSRNGQIYNTVLIGEQCWMKENLNVGTRINGSQEQMDNGIIEKYCHGDLESNCDAYGGLYQWNEMMQYITSEGAQGICPDGWHIPTDAEWTMLTDYLGGESVAGGKMKEAGLTHWASPNTGATNESGFTALPGGLRYYDGWFGNLTYDAFFRSSSQGGVSIAWGRTLTFNYEGVYRGDGYKADGVSARCVQD